MLGLPEMPILDRYRGDARTARVGSRLIAAACVVIAAPAMLIVISWSPAVVLSLGHYYRALNISGTQSFHQDMASQFKQSIITVVIIAASTVAWFGYIFIARNPRPKRDQFVWLFAATVIVAHLFINAPSLRVMNRDGILLFRRIPMVVGILSLLGMLMSRKAIPRVDA
jgi:hypothetical protein